MQTFLKDLGFGIRSLLKRRGFTLVAITTLALGIGATTAIFSVVNGLLLRPLPYRDDQHLVMLGQSNRKMGVAREGVAPANFLDWREQSRSFEAVAAAEQWGYTLTDYGEPEAMRGWVVTKGFFEILGTNALVGRTLLPEEYEQEKPVVVISYGLWQRRFGGDQQIIGRQLTLNRELTTVVGVMPPEFDYPQPANRELWGPRRARPNDPQMRGGSLFKVIGRLRDGVALEQAQQEMNGIAARLGQQYPQTNSEVGAVVVPLREQLVGAVRLPLYILFGAVGLVLLIACANVASLLLVRAAEREREFAVRAALGASGSRLLRQLLTESLLLSLLGGLGGLLVAKGLIQVIVAVSPSNLPLAQIQLNPIVLGFAVAVSLMTAVIFGLAPAIQASRTNLQDVLRAGRSETGGRRRQRIRQTLVISEIALALVVLVGAGLLVRSFVALLNTDPGFTPDKGLALEVQMGTLSVPERNVFVDQVLEKLTALPGVQAVAVSSALPFHDNQVALPSPIKISDRPAGPAGSEPIALMIKASEGYFRAVGVPLLQGRLFDQRDRANAPPVVLVNETMARRLWPADTPIGRTISFTAAGQNLSAEIIGVVGAVRPTGFDSEPRPEFYLHYPQSPASLVTVFVRTSGDPGALLPAVKAEIREVNPNQAFLSVHTIAQLVDKTTAQRRFNLLWLGAFAVMALILATVGLYGLISFSTAQRTREIGVRMALGAQRGDVMKLVMREGISLALIGVTLGLVAVAAASRLMTSLLFGVSSTDPLTFVSAAGLLTLVALLACYIPARRATRVDPLVALRCE
ncbi:MAG TPA: ABC transporter permease [Pyrinomonadaceae bacterium]|nr:ABC transporter permease [Pyrinomonadaceae bacterium]